MHCSCGSPVNHLDDFCPHCGALLLEEVHCSRHSPEKALGVCIICSKPFCATCGGWLGGLFLCNEHRGYEVIEGMAKVFGGSDGAQVEHAKNCLEKSDLHPFFFSRKATPGPDHALFRELDGHIVDEYKVMVPCNEVMKAEDVLKKLDLVEMDKTS